MQKIVYAARDRWIGPSAGVSLILYTVGAIIIDARTANTGPEQLVPFLALLGLLAYYRFRHRLIQAYTWNGRVPAMLNAVLFPAVLLAGWFAVRGLVELSGLA